MTLDTQQTAKATPSILGEPSPAKDPPAQKLARRPKRMVRCGDGVSLVVLVIIMKFDGVDTDALG